MLTARKVPRACQSCRLQLLTLFEHGFTSSATANASRRRYHATGLPRRNPPSRFIASARHFSATSRRTEEPKENLPAAHIPSAAEIELFVRQAKETFGDTLPKDYLSQEEYVVYERLFGPPLRETRPDDLEFMPDEEEVPEEQIRNVIIKENADGEYEEIEFDPKLGFSVVENEPEVAVDVEGEEAILVAEAAEEFEVDEEYLIAAEPADFAVDEESNLDVKPAEFLSDEELEIALEGIIDDIEETPEVEEKRIEYLGQNQRERDVMARLKLDMEAAQEAAAQLLSEELEVIGEEEEEYLEEEEEVEEDEEDEDDEPYYSAEDMRAHPHTVAGRSRTNPTSIYLPKSTMIAPITQLLERTNMKHLQTAAETAFGGKGLPFSTSTPGSKKNLEQKEIGLSAAQHKMSEIEADAYISAVMPGTYAAVMSALVETRKRLGPNWIRDLIFREGGEGPRVLDCSAGAGLIAWREIVQAEWDILKADGIVEGDEAPSGKSAVLTGPPNLRSRVSRFLENTSFLPRLPDYFHARSERRLDGENAGGERKTFDVVIAPHMLFPLKEDFRRRNMSKTLWSLLEPNGGVLVVIEKGLPRGFEAVASARSLFLDKYISSPGREFHENELTDLSDSKVDRFIKKEEGSIIAPCTNHEVCPMYPVPGFTFGRKDYCHFRQRFIRPDFLQRVLGSKLRNHEDVNFSYLSVRRGVDIRKEYRLPDPAEATQQSFEGYEYRDLPESDGAEQSDVKFHPLALPRAILNPLKRRGHVVLDLCTPEGKLERWTVPRSFSKAAYRDARKSKWGDLWALGAKTRVVRTPRLGKGATEKGGTGLKGIRDGKQGKGGKKMKQPQYDMVMGDFGFEGIRRTDKGRNIIDPTEKRTKGGRKPKPQRPIGEDDL